MLSRFDGISLLNHKRVTRYTKKIEQIVAKIQAGVPGCHVEKLNGSSLWSARFNDEERMLFTYMQWKGKTYLFVLDYLAHHDYHRSHILKDPVALASYEAQCKAELAALFSENDQPEEPSSDAEVLEEKTPPPAPPIILTSFGKGTWVQLSEEQEDAIKVKKFPLLVTGPAGSGKTCVAFALLSDRLDELSSQIDEDVLAHPDEPRKSLPKLLYLTRYPHLAQDMQRRWRERPMPEGYADAVEFMTVEEFLEKQKHLTHRPEPTQKDKQIFSDWYKQFFAKKQAKHAKDNDLSRVKKAVEKLKKSTLDANSLYGLRQKNELPDEKNEFQIVLNAYRQNLLEKEQKDQALFGVQWVEGKFFFKWLAQTKRNKLKIHPYVLYEEFKICCGYSKEDYVSLGKRQSSIPQEKRASVYALYDTYKKYLDRIGYMDPLLLSADKFESLSEQPFRSMIVDEAQTLSASWYHWLGTPPSTKESPQVSFFCDSHQGSGIYLSEHLKNVIPSEPINLRTMHRCSAFSVALVNKVLTLKHDVLGGKADKLAADQIEHMGDNPHITQPYLVDQASLEAKQHPLVTQEKDAEVLVITHAQHVEAAKKIFKTPLVLMPDQVRGLQFKTVILYYGDEQQGNAAPANPDESWGDIFFKQVEERLLSQQQEASQEDLPEAAEDLSSKHSVYRPKSDTAQPNDAIINAGFNEFYAAITRATENIVIVHNNSPSSQTFFSQLGNTVSREAVPEDLGMGHKISEKEVIKKIKELVYNGQGQLAYQIYHIQATQNKEKIKNLLAEEFTIEGPVNARFLKMKQKPPCSPAAEVLEVKESDVSTTSTSSSSDEERSPSPAVVSQINTLPAVAAAEVPKTILPVSYEQQFPLHTVIKTGRPSDIRKALKSFKTKPDEEKKNFIHVKDSEGYTPMKLAVKADKLDVIKEFMCTAKMSDPDSFLETCEQLLLLAKTKSSMEKYLLEELKKAQKNLKNLEEIKIKNTKALMDAVKSDDNIQQVKGLLKNNADVNGRNKKGFTPLDKACQYGCEKIVNLLLSENARVDVITKDKPTTFLIALKGNVPEIIKCLIKKAQQDIKNGIAKYSMGELITSLQIAYSVATDPNIKAYIEKEIAEMAIHLTRVALSTPDQVYFFDVLGGIDFIHMLELIESKLNEDERTLLIHHLKGLDKFHVIKLLAHQHFHQLLSSMNPANEAVLLSSVLSDEIKEIIAKKSHIVLSKFFVYQFMHKNCLAVANFENDFQLALEIIQKNYPISEICFSEEFFAKNQKINHTDENINVLVNALTCNDTLRNILVEGCHGSHMDEDISHFYDNLALALSEIVKKKGTFEEICLFCPGSAASNLVIKMLRDIKKLKKITLKGIDFSREDICENIVNILRENKTLTHIELVDSDMEDDDILAIGRALQYRTKNNYPHLTIQLDGPAISYRGLHALRFYLEKDASACSHLPNTEEEVEALYQALHIHKTAHITFKWEGYLDLLTEDFIEDVKYCEKIKALGYEDVEAHIQEGEIAKEAYQRLQKRHGLEEEENASDDCDDDAEDDGNDNDPEEVASISEAPAEQAENDGWESLGEEKVGVPSTWSPGFDFRGRGNPLDQQALPFKK